MIISFVLFLLLSCIQDVFQIKQQQAIYELRKELHDLRHATKDRMAEYIRDMAAVEKEVLVAEKRLHKSKEALDQKIQAKVRCASSYTRE